VQVRSRAYILNRWFGESKPKHEVALRPVVSHHSQIAVLGLRAFFPAETCGEGIAGTKSYNVSDLPKKSANDSRSSFAVESGKKMRESVQHGNLSFFRKSTPFCGGDKSKEAAAKRARQGQLK
jgi:hypothetical protein